MLSQLTCIYGMWTCNPPCAVANPGQLISRNHARSERTFGADTAEVTQWHCLLRGRALRINRNCLRVILYMRSGAWKETSQMGSCPSV